MSRLNLRDGTEIFYTTDGPDTEPMLLVHGLAGDHSGWSQQVARFASGHRVTAVDLRGHGRSGQDGQSFGSGVFSSDLAELLIGLHLAPVTAVGHSMGALVVNRLAVEHPALVGRVVNLDPGYGFGAQESVALAELGRSAAGPQVHDVVLRLLAAAEGPHLDAALRTQRQERILATPAHVLSATLTDTVVTNPLGSRPAIDGLLGQRRCPFLSIYAEGREATANWERSFVGPGDRVVLVGGTGHWIHQEKPVEVNDLIEEWLAVGR